MRHKLLAILLCSLSAGYAAALPKVAVLDAVLPQNMEKDIAIGITEKISEALVNSGKFTVLDRTSVDQSLKEIEFQMSGIVSNAEIKKAGERLGAAYVVVARVSFVTGTYFVTAKMIDVRTGEIAAQSSDQEEGKASITFKVAERVGTKLAQGTAVAAAVPEGKAVEPEVKAVRSEAAKPPDLVAWYKMDETEGTVVSDSSGNGKNGTLIGGPSWEPGKIGNAVHLQSRKYVKLPEGLVSSLSDFTISGWVKLDYAYKWYRIFDFGSNTSVYMQFTTANNESVAQFGITLNDWQSEQRVDGSIGISAGKWHHFAITLLNKTGIMYIDGKNVSGKKYLSLCPLNLGKTVNNYLGRSHYQDDRNNLQGLLDDFRIYNRALNPTEIAALFSEAK